MPPSSIKGVTRTKKNNKEANTSDDDPVVTDPPASPLNLLSNQLQSIDENHIKINIEEKNIPSKKGGYTEEEYGGGDGIRVESINGDIHAGDGKTAPTQADGEPLIRSFSSPPGAENDVTSEGDIENENGSCKQLLVILYKIDSHKRANSKFRRITSLTSINTIIDKVIDDIRAIKYVDTENKKLINTLKVKLTEIEKNLSEGNTVESKYKGLYEDILEVYNKFKSKNFDELERVKKDKLKMNINHEKDFNKHLQNKLNFLNDRLDLLQMKYNGYKNWYDRMNIGIIIISTVLSVFESFRLEIQDLIHENNHGLTIVFNMTPIIISSSITCSAAVIKFKKYQEKMEDMQFAREKVITSISKIEYVMESLWFNKDVDFDTIKNDYLKDVFTVYNESIAELKRHIKFDDPQKLDKHIDDKNKENNKNKNKKSYI